MIGEDMMVNDPNRTNPEATDRVEDAADKARDRVRSDYDKAKSEAGAQLHAAEYELSGQYEKARHEVEAGVKQAGAAARDFAADQKNYTAGQLGNVADAVDRVAGELDADQPTIARYAHDLADGVRRVSDTTRTSSVEELAHRTESFGRSNPATFLGAAALLGFAASRFMTASSDRMRRHDAEASVPAQPHSSLDSF